MLELTGDIWEQHEAGNWIVITTNGDVNSRGEAVMGRGVALQAKQRLWRLARSLGTNLKPPDSNHVMVWPDYRIVTFPVKHHWHERADLELIERSCLELVGNMSIYHLPPPPVYLVRPGCGNGGLDWAVVQPVVDCYLDDRFVVVERPSSA